MSVTYIATFPGNYVIRKSSNERMYHYAWRVINGMGEVVASGFCETRERAEKASGVYTVKYPSSTEPRRAEIVRTTVA